MKILLVGPRYTGKGQIGRAWGNTDADLPTLQPVILYDRMVKFDDREARVVAWVLSFDPEFEDLRHCFYEAPDGVIFTFDITDDTGDSLKYMNRFKGELGTLECPQALAGVQIAESRDQAPGLEEEVDKQLAKLREGHSDGEMVVGYFTLYYPDKAGFQHDVDAMFSALLEKIKEG